MGTNETTVHVLLELDEDLAMAMTQLVHRWSLQGLGGVFQDKV